MLPVLQNCFVKQQPHSILFENLFMGSFFSYKNKNSVHE